MKTITVQLRQRGALALPREVCEKYRLGDGDLLTLRDFDGVLLLSPKVAVVPKLTAQIERLRREARVSMNDLRRDRCTRSPVNRLPTTPATPDTPRKTPSLP